MGFLRWLLSGGGRSYSVKRVGKALGPWQPYSGDDVIPRTRLPRQLDCPECGKPMRLRESRHGLFYGCSDYPTCKGTHGAHPDGRPLGKPADQHTKKMRIVAHNVFDPLWEADDPQFKTRPDAYEWMQQAMGMTPGQAHIGNFTAAECKRLVEAVWAEFGS